MREKLEKEKGLNRRKNKEDKKKRKGKEKEKEKERKKQLPGNNSFPWAITHSTIAISEISKAEV